ncbi:MAG: iron-sulfur cluster assembly protein [Firmicutes bacterium]|nr:iron-sulfur cluster assembly protein [Bacillota bacterium]
MLSEAEVWACLAAVPDPELAPVTLVELGLITDVRLTAAGVVVTLRLPTAQCPGLAEIRRCIAESLAPMAVWLSYDFTDAAWPSMSGTARIKLREQGIAVPEESWPFSVSCPYCASTHVECAYPWGKTLCVARYACQACHRLFDVWTRQ